MKAIKSLLICLSLLTLPFASLKAELSSRTSEDVRLPFAQSVRLEQYKFYTTTSTLMSSGSALPIAARNGFINGSSDEDASSYYGPRRIGGSGSGTGGNEAEENDDPQETPIGDGVWAMLVMAAGYLIYRVRTRKREVMA